jgi:hypothetical protein
MLDILSLNTICSGLSSSKVYWFFNFTWSLLYIVFDAFAIYSKINRKSNIFGDYFAVFAVFNFITGVHDL